MKVLVVGAGSIGRRHLANLRALGADRISLCDVDGPARQAAASAFGVDAYARLEEGLDTGPDAVLVCTPTHLHLPVLRAALETGAHVFVEKPLAASLEGTAALAALARERGRVVLVGCNMRFHPGVAHLKEALATGVPARPLTFRARFSHYLPNWRPGTDYRQSYSARRVHGGGIVAESVHEIDYLRWLGGEVVRVAGHVARLSDLEIESEDWALLLLELQSGALAEIHLDYLSPLKLRGCEIVGVDGVLRWTSEGKQPEAVRVERFDPAGARRETLYASEAYDGNAMYVEELRHFLDCCAGGAAPLLDLDGARRVLALTLAARDAPAGEWQPAPELAALPAVAT